MPNAKFYFIENYLPIKIHVKNPQCLWNKSQTSLCCLCLSSLSVCELLGLFFQTISDSENVLPEML